MTTLVESLYLNSAANERESAFAALLAQTQRHVFRIAYSILWNAADAEEVAQEVFLRAYRRFSSLRDPAKFHAWVSRIAVRLALNHQRAKRRRLARDTAWQRSRPEAVADGSQEASNRLFLERLRGEIDRLPEKLRVVLLLCAVQGLDPCEAATVLQINVGTLRSRLHHARRRLLEAMNP